MGQQTGDRFRGSAEESGVCRYNEANWDNNQTAKAAIQWAEKPDDVRL
jgi:hypothetical protein